VAEQQPKHTFLFADLAGFTALTEAHGDEEAADLAADFFQSVRTLLPEYGATEIKVMGDELMIHAEDADAAVRLATCIVCEIGAQHGFPTIRIGVHTGPAVERDGDWFGSAVNLAARIAAMATGGEVLLSDQTREAAGEIEGIDLEQRGRRELRNVREPVLLYAAVRSSERSQRGLPIDPVCRMAVDPEHCAGSLHHGGIEYFFCSLACVEAFASEPSQYARQAPT
jgi:adenylate cyclase